MKLNKEEKEYFIAVIGVLVAVGAMLTVALL